MNNNITSLNSSRDLALARSVDISHGKAIPGRDVSAVAQDCLKLIKLKYAPETTWALPRINIQPTCDIPKNKLASIFEDFTTFPLTQSMALQILLEAFFTDLQVTNVKVCTHGVYEISFPKTLKVDDPLLSAILATVVKITIVQKNDELLMEITEGFKMKWGIIPSVPSLKIGPSTMSINSPITISAFGFSKTIPLMNIYTEIPNLKWIPV